MKASEFARYHSVHPVCSCGMDYDFIVVGVQFVAYLKQEKNPLSKQVNYVHDGRLEIHLHCGACESSQIINIYGLDDMQAMGTMPKPNAN